MNPLWSLLQRWASGLRFPYLLLLTATLFVVDLFVPDLVPAIDEILLGLSAMLFATWRKQKKEKGEPDEGPKDPPPGPEGAS